jgi:hypothetical protein
MLFLIHFCFPPIAFNRVKRFSSANQQQGIVKVVSYVCRCEVPLLTPRVFRATYLRPNPYVRDGFIELPSNGREILTSNPARVSDRISGRLLISESIHAYRIRLPRQVIPEGATQIHAMPLFVEMSSPFPVVSDIFDQGPALHSQEFTRFIQSVTQGSH